MIRHLWNKHLSLGSSLLFFCGGFLFCRLLFSVAAFFFSHQRLLLLLHTNSLLSCLPYHRLLAWNPSHLSWLPVLLLPYPSGVYNSCSRKEWLFRLLVLAYGFSFNTIHGVLYGFHFRTLPCVVLRGLFGSLSFSTDHLTCGKHFLVRRQKRPTCSPGAKFSSVQFASIKESHSKDVSEGLHGTVVLIIKEAGSLLCCIGHIWPLPALRFAERHRPS